VDSPCDRRGVEFQVYFVHSFRALPSEACRDWVLTLTTYGHNFIRYCQGAPK
jgi:imidazoleglycerol phosphate synthase glutamine amidotransferase subunit HisH